MIWTQVAEASNNPVASSVQVGSALKLPFPVLTFANDNYEASIETFFERLFNRLPFDCSQAVQEKNPKCLTDSKKVRATYRKDIDLAFEKLFKAHYSLASESFSKLLYTDHCFLSRDLGYRYINPLLAANLSSVEFNELYMKLFGYAKRSFLLFSNNKQLGTDFLKDTLKEVNATYWKVTNCALTSDLSRMKRNQVAALVHTYLIFISAERVPLGTFLRDKLTASWFNPLSYFRDLHKDIKRLISTLIPSKDKNKYFDIINLSYLSGGGCLMKSYPIREVTHEYFRFLLCQEMKELKQEMLATKGQASAELVEHLILGIPPFLSSFVSSTFDKLAIKAKEALGLKHVIEGEEVVDSPSMWHCIAKTPKSSACSNIQLSLTENGYGFSFNMGKWNDTFQFDIFGQRHEDLRNNFLAPFGEEITLYILNPDDK
jgi:hypothetical protein